MASIFQYVKRILFLLFVILSVSSCSFRINRRWFALNMYSRRVDTLKSHFYSGFDFVFPAPRMAINEIREYEHLYIFRVHPYMNRHTQYLVFSIRDDNQQIHTGQADVQKLWDKGDYESCLFSDKLVPVYKEDSDNMMYYLCKDLKSEREKAEAKKRFLKENYYEEYYVLDAKYNQGNLYTISDMNGVHRLADGDSVVNRAERFFIELAEDNNHRKEYHVYIRKY